MNNICFVILFRSFGQTKSDPDTPNLETIEKDEDSVISVKQVQSTINSHFTQNSSIGERKESSVTETMDIKAETNTCNSSNHAYLANMKSSPKPIVLQSLSDSDYLDSTGRIFRNRRLLLNCKNNLHIIDGENYRYYIGIIDFFTLFRLRQKAGKLFKDLKTCCGSHSTEPPEVYGQRFVEFITERTT